VLGREVAIKAIPLGADTFFRQQIEANFLNEAKAAGGLNHPYIVTVFDAGKTDALAYIAMERLHGRDLHDVMAVGQKLPLREVARLMARVADAVHYAHKRGIVHRDIKPSNIFLLKDGKPRVLDFGVALPMMGDGNQTHRRQLIGTPNYMSPEQALGKKLDARSDVFSIGSILYELIGGQRAFEGRTVEETLAQVVADNPTPLETLRPDAPADLLSIVKRALAKDLNQRYQTAGELRNELAAFGGSRADAQTARRGPPTVTPAWRRVLLNPGMRWGIAAGTAVVAALVVVLVQRGQDSPPATAIAAPAPTVVPVMPAPPPPAAADTAATDPAEDGPGADAKRPARMQTSTAVAMAPREGYVALAVAPWGEVIVNGVSRGVSPPLTRLTLGAGTHIVEVRNGTATPYRTRIEIKPGQTVSLQHRF
jgi:serine/threonine-protein kinase